MTFDFQQISKADLRLVNFKVREIRHLTKQTFVIRVDRNSLDFLPGQHVRITLQNDNKKRKYSIYSGSNKNYLEFIVREVEDGYLTPKLKKIQVGDMIEVLGPDGNFTIYEEIISENKFLFIATGTGIAPFHSYVQTYPHMDFHMLHGVSSQNEAYERGHYALGKYTLCTSKETTGNFSGRVTDYLRKHRQSTDQQVYLCGNNQMIIEAIDILKEQGFADEQIYTEVYF